MLVGSLGDFFPEEFKEDFSDRQLKIGSVIRCKVRDTNPPKIKIFIVVGFTKDDVALGTVYINTELNNFIKRDHRLLSAQVKLDSNGREYLKHECFVDCSKIFKRSVAEVKSIIENDIEALAGELSPHDLITINRILQSTKTIAPAMKRLFGIIP